MPNLVTRLTLDKGQFDRNIAGATKQVRDMDKNFKAAGKTLSSFGGGLGVNVGGLGAFATAAGLAAAAGQGLKVVLESNQITGDALASSLHTLETVTNNLAVALGTADFSAFNQGLGVMIDKARAAYDAMDQLGNTAMSFSYFSTKNAAAVRNLGLEVKDALASGDIEAAMQSYAKAAEIVSQQAIDATNARARVNEAVSASIAAASTLYEGDIKRKDIEDALRIDLMGDPARVRAELTQQYDEYVKAREQIMKEKGKEGFNWKSLVRVIPIVSTAAHAAGLDMSATTNYSTEETDRLQRELDKQNKKLIVAKTLLQNYTDDQLKAVIEQLNMADAYDQSTAAIEKQTQAMKKQIDAARKTKAEATGKIGARAKGTVKDKLTGISVGMAANMARPADLIPTQLQGVEMIDTTSQALADFNRQLQAMSAAQSIIGSIGDAMRSLTGDTVAARAATAALVVVTEALAVAEAVKSASGGDPYTIAARIAAAAAACISAFASIGFAEGGIVGGSGGRKSDKVNVRASAGEMILTGQQQANLWHTINNKASAGRGQVEFKIRGQELYGVLGNYNDKRNRIL